MWAYWQSMPVRAPLVCSRATATGRPENSRARPAAHTSIASGVACNCPWRFLPSAVHRLQSCFSSAQSSPIQAAQTATSLGTACGAGVGAAAAAVAALVVAASVAAGGHLYLCLLQALDFTDRQDQALSKAVDMRTLRTSRSCRGAVFVSAGCLLALLLCHRLSPMAIARTFFFHTPPRPAAVDFSISPPLPLE